MERSKVRTSKQRTRRVFGNPTRTDLNDQQAADMPRIFDINNDDTPQNSSAQSRQLSLSLCIYIYIYESKIGSDVKVVHALNIVVDDDDEGYYY